MHLKLIQHYSQGSVLAEWLGRMVGVGQMVSGRIFFPSPEVSFFSLKWAAGKSPDLPWAASPSTEQQAAAPWSWAELCPCHPHSGPPRNCGCDLICTCSLHWCAQVKMSSHWSRVDPNPITSILKKKREIWIQAHTHTHTGEGHVKRDTETKMLLLQVKECQGLPATTRG